MYVQCIDYVESDMKEDTLQVSELPMHTTSNGCSVLNGFIGREVQYVKIMMEFLLMVLPQALQVKSALFTKIKDSTGNNLLSMHFYTHRQQLMF